MAYCWCFQEVIPNAPANNLGTDVNRAPLSDNNKRFPKLNFACQNVCSLNISKPNKRTHSKLITVTKSGADIIFLSDTRLNSDKQIAGVNDIVKKIRFMGYSFYHNSRKNSRGVAVLLSNRINYAIRDTFCDENCNMLLQKLVIGNISITLGSIYGGNSNTNRTEFISFCCFICQPEWWNKKYFWLYEEKILWRQFCSIS
jgi:hypothetical protein